MGDFSPTVRTRFMLLLLTYANLYYTRDVWYRFVFDENEFDEEENDDDFYTDEFNEEENVRFHTVGFVIVGFVFYASMELLATLILKISKDRFNIVQFFSNIAHSLVKERHWQITGIYMLILFGRWLVLPEDLHEYTKEEEEFRFSNRVVIVVGFAAFIVFEVFLRLANRIHPVFSNPFLRMLITGAILWNAIQYSEEDEEEEYTKEGEQIVLAGLTIFYAFDAVRSMINSDVLIELLEETIAKGLRIGSILPIIFSAIFLLVFTGLPFAMYFRENPQTFDLVFAYVNIGIGAFIGTLLSIWMQPINNETVQQNSD